MVDRISVVALIGYLFVPLPVLAQCQVTQADKPNLTVKGSGVVQIPPDFVRLRMDVVTRGPTLAGVSKAHQARMGGTGAVLDKLKTDGMTVRQGAFNVVQEPARTVLGTNMRVEPATFRAETSYVLEAKSLDKVDAEVGYAIASGLFELTGISYGVEHRDEGLNQARRAAVVDARGQADIYADAAGVRLVLLRHKRVGGLVACRSTWQHGHRSRLLARATVSMRRMVAMELGTWRSGRVGGAVGSSTTGNGSFRPVQGGARV